MNDEPATVTEDIRRLLGKYWKSGGMVKDERKGEVK